MFVFLDQLVFFLPLVSWKLATEVRFINSQNILSL